MNRFLSCTLFPDRSTTTSIVLVAQPPASYELFRPVRVASISNEAFSAQATLDELGKLKEDWDGYGALPITSESRVYAQKFLAVKPEGMSIPDISPTSNGTITFEWTSTEGDALLEIGRTRYSGHIQPKHGQTFYLQGTLGNSTEQQVATGQVLAVVKQLLYAASGPNSLTHSVSIAQQSL